MSEKTGVQITLPKMLWLEIDLRHKELPVRVADSAEELARMAGVSLSTIKASASRGRHGKRSRYITVWIAEEVCAV